MEGSDVALIDLGVFFSSVKVGRNLVMSLVNYGCCSSTREKQKICGRQQGENKKGKKKGDHKSWNFIPINENIQI